MVRLILPMSCNPLSLWQSAGCRWIWYGTLNIALAMPNLLLDPVARATYLPGGAPAAPEQFLRLGELSATLHTLAREGAEVFYRGQLAEMMAEDLRAGGSCITSADFAAYQVLEHESLSTRHRGVDIHTAGPTSGGPRLVEALAYIADNLQLGADRSSSPRHLGGFTRRR